jgi:hypothetical protein
VITKRFGVDFSSPGGALTLDPHDVSKCEAESGTHTLTHDDGWTITGEIHEDYSTWVSDFTAVHSQYGRVWGDFEGDVYADSEEGFADFYARHPPVAWDYADI